ncbi:MAG TPA: P-loop NTPase [Acidobacteriota bacterium]
MNSQALTEPVIERAVRPDRRIVAIASGKGGVGKTVITANLAHALAADPASRHQKIVAVDLDLGCGNLNTCMGVRNPSGNISDFLMGRTTSLSPILSRTEQPSLEMISCSYRLEEAQPDRERKGELLENLRGLDARFVLLDLGAGTSPEVLDFFLSADHKIVVITPESLSLHNAFLFLKTAIMHFVLRELEQKDFLQAVRAKLRELVEGKEDFNLRNVIEQLKLWDLYAGYILSGMINDLKVKIVVNMYRGRRTDKRALTNFNNLLFRYLQLRSNLGFLGFVHFDPHVPESVQKVQPFLPRYPRSRAAQDIRHLAARLLKDAPLEYIPPLKFPKRPWWERVLRRL